MNEAFVFSLLAVKVMFKVHYYFSSSKLIRISLMCLWCNVYFNDLDMMIHMYLVL